MVRSGITAEQRAKLDHPCPWCKGTGEPPATGEYAKRDRCPNCGGTGVMWCWRGSRLHVPAAEAITLPDGRTVCPACGRHEQGDTEYHDCKTLFMDGNRVVGQCGCYSYQHGRRSG